MNLYFSRRFQRGYFSHRILTGLLCVATILATVGAPATEAIRAAVERLQLSAKDAGTVKTGDIEIYPSPVKGVSEVVVGANVLYISNDGEYILAGPMVKVADRSNLTEQRLSQMRSKVLADTDGLRMFHYPAKKATHKVTVFTDIDCPYCRRMHSDMDGYSAAGIDVNYVMLPRAGVGSASYKKTINAACADDPEAAITAAMAGNEPAAATCKHPIDEHLALARQLNIGSTPSIVLEDGRIVLGYQKPAQLLQRISKKP